MQSFSCSFFSQGGVGSPCSSTWFYCQHFARARYNPASTKSQGLHRRSHLSAGQIYLFPTKHGNMSDSRFFFFFFLGDSSEFHAPLQMDHDSNGHFARTSNVSFFQLVVSRFTLYKQRLKYESKPPIQTTTLKNCPSPPQKKNTKKHPPRLALACYLWTGA